MGNDRARDQATDVDAILLGLESLRADHFTEENFPQCWPFFEEFAHFENAYANGVATPLSYQSVHTGRPIELDSTLPEEHPTIAECYDGYSAAISNNIHLLPSRGYDRGFDSFEQYPSEIKSSTTKSVYYKLRTLAGKSDVLTAMYDRFWDSAESVTSERMTQRQNRSAENVLSIFGDEVLSRHGLFWTHVFDTHSPFYPDKVLDRDLDVTYSDDEITAMHGRFENGTASEEDITFLKETYGEIIGYVDRQLASFFERLKRNDRWEDALIVVFGDHGECFGEEGIYGHGWDNPPIDPLIRVPVVVKYPKGQYAGERFSHPVQVGDIFATLADYFDWDVDVPPNTRPFTDAEQRPVVSKSNTTVRVITDSASAIRSFDGVREEGNLNPDARDVLKSATIPRADDLSGNIPGLDEREREQVDQRLKYLGYK